MTTLLAATRLRAEQLDEAGAVITRAFFDDPAMVYVLPDASKRAGPLGWLMFRTARYGHRHGETYTTPGETRGLASWLRPGEAHISIPRMIPLGLALAPFRFGPGGFRRFLRIFAALDPVREQVAPSPHWYLMTLGVDPPLQGQGIGGSLIQPGLARADADGLPCYLETMKEINVAFYRRHGFEVVAEGDIPAGGPHYWTMLRAPRG